MAPARLSHLLKCPRIMSTDLDGLTCKVFKAARESYFVDTRSPSSESVQLMQTYGLMPRRC
jgi:hypothetical protein